MPVFSQAEEGVARVLFLDLARKLLQTLLWDFDKAWQVWLRMDQAARAEVVEVYELWRAKQEPERLPGGVEPETLHVQLLNIAGSRGRDARAFLESVRRTGGIPQNLYKLPEDDPGRVWRPILMGLTGAPRWALIVGAWNALTPDFRRLVELASADDPAPETLNDPEGIAWLDRVVQRGKGRPDELVIRTYRDLPEGSPSALAEVLMDQQVAWTEARVVPVSGCVQKIDYFVPDAMARLACFGAPLEPAVLRKALKLKLRSPGGIYRAATPETLGLPHVDEDIKDAGHYDEGFELVKEAQAGRVSCGEGGSWRGLAPEGGSRAVAGVTGRGPDPA